MTRERRPILSIRCKPRHEHEAERLLQLARKHSEQRASEREPQEP